MAHPYHHSLSSVKKWGGTVDDYLAIHSWFDASKQITADFRHRALRHHAEGIFMAETIFGPTVTLSSGRVIPTRWIGEQHVIEALAPPLVEHEPGCGGRPMHDLGHHLGPGNGKIERSARILERHKLGLARHGLVG